MPYSHRRRLRHRHSSIHDRRSNERSASAASEPFYDGSRSFGIEGSWIDGPNRPTPSTAALRRLQDKRAAPQSKPSRFHLEEAFGLMHEALESTYITTIPCLGRSSDTGTHFSVRDLPFMVFDDLDKKLFRSTLKGNVYLTWASLPHGVRGRTSRPGLHGRPRITIKLSFRVAKDRAATIGVLLHQMIHAYYLQSCGHKNKGVVGKGHDLRHNEEFENLCRSIKEHFLPGEKPVWDAANDLLPVEADVSYYPPEAGCSDCYYRSSRIKKVKVDRWRIAAVALAIARSARRVASGSGGEGGSNDGNNRSAE
jgi:hypothetical protein